MYRHILVPIAFDHERDPAPALRVARLLAAEGARLTFLHVMEEAPPFAISYMPPGYREDLRRAIQAELDRIAGEAGGGAGVLIEGHAGRSILDWAEDNEADCIVLAAHRPDVQEYHLGSTAGHVVRHAACSVHVLR